jgi:hypothetical protein
MSAGIRISELSISEVLDNLRERRWQVPRFQREFVWDTSAIAGLATSVIDGYPIGMVTLWEQPTDSHIELEPLSIDDWDTQNKSKTTRHFGHEHANPSSVKAILDGRQRSTALAMAFAGFSPQYGRNRNAGRYFLNASLKDPLERVIFKKKSAIDKEGLTNLHACIAKGYFPLSSFKDGQSILQQWYGYIQLLKDESIYPQGAFPTPEELQRRDGILQKAFEGISETKLGACTVPQRYDLGQICEIFETLNLTGMKVSTVDLINSWLLRDTEDKVHLRDWMDRLSETQGAFGWSVPKKRPELVAQLVTSCFVSLSDLPSKPEARRVAGSSKKASITSVKSSDLLATPTEHWLKIVAHTEEFSEFIGDFQNIVAGGQFGYQQCPYPISSGIYVGLRWHKKFDPEYTHTSWTVADLNKIFRPFFWRNSLSARYDQGFLTQMGTDITTFKTLLTIKGSFPSSSDWISYVRTEFDKLIKSSDMPSREELITYLTDGRPGGALQAALMLPMVARSVIDFEGNQLVGETDTRTDIHHIYPTRWCKENASGDLFEVLSKENGGPNYVDSISNLMPLSSQLNGEWSSKSPATYIASKGLTYEGDAAVALQNAFIDEEGFAMLKKGPSLMEQFWLHRAGLIADHLLSLASLPDA